MGKCAKKAKNVGLSVLKILAAWAAIYILWTFVEYSPWPEQWALWVRLLAGLMALGAAVFIYDGEDDCCD